MVSLKVRNLLHPYGHSCQSVLLKHPLLHKSIYKMVVQSDLKATSRVVDLFESTEFSKTRIYLMTIITLQRSWLVLLCVFKLITFLSDDDDDEDDEPHGKYKERSHSLAAANQKSFPPCISGMR